MRAYKGQIFRLPAHLDRLYGSAAYLGLRIPMSKPECGRYLRQSLSASGFKEAVVRIALFPSKVESDGRRTAVRAASPSVVVQPAQIPPESLYRTGLRVAVVPTRKFPVGQIDPRAKFSARLGSIMAVMEAQLRGADEAIFLDASGAVTESTASNLGIVKRGVFLASPCWLGLLAGVTWQALTEIADSLGIPYRETPLTRHELYNADEVFLLSTLKEVMPVTTIDGRSIGTGRPGPYAKRLRRAFRELVERELRTPISQHHKDTRPPGHKSHSTRIK